MKKVKAKVIENKPIADRMMELVFRRPKGVDIRPGQFINIRIDGCFLRRPISICDWSEDTVTIIYRTVGRGTELMAKMRPEDEMDILIPLGNGYEISRIVSEEACESKTVRPLLIGGGAGIPPMIGLCRCLIEEGYSPQVVTGFRGGDEVFGIDDFKALGVDPIITTEDGSAGVKGFVTDVIGDLESTCFFVCGPEPMLRAVDDVMDKDLPGQFSFEERMGCGFGACMGCSCETKYGYKRICREGPVLTRDEIIWE